MQAPAVLYLCPVSVDYPFRLIPGYINVIWGKVIENIGRRKRVLTSDPALTKRNVAAIR